MIEKHDTTNESEYRKICQRIARYLNAEIHDHEQYIALHRYIDGFELILQPLSDPQSRNNMYESFLDNLIKGELMGHTILYNKIKCLKSKSITELIMKMDIMGI